MHDVNAAGQVRRHRMSAGQRRESILKAAIEVFTTAGYRAGKVSDVAARVGVTEPVIFQNFGSKAALFAAVLDRVAEDLRTELDTLVKRHGSATELLTHVLSAPHTHGPHLLSAQGPRPPGAQQPDLPGVRGSLLPGEQGPRLPDAQGPCQAGDHGPDVAGAQGPCQAGDHGPDVAGAQGPLFADAISLTAEPKPSALGPLFADAISLTAESEASEPGRRILRTLADHLADLLRRGQADGDIRSDLDAEAGAWLVLSILAARPLRAAMPDRDRLDSGVAALALQAVVQSRPANVPG